MGEGEVLALHTIDNVKMISIKEGTRLARYELVQRIGNGGMGDIWLATSHGTAGFQKQVVIKTVAPHLSSNPAFVSLLQEEARISAELSHPNLIEVFDFAEEGGLHYLAMEYVRGRSLSKIMQECSKLKRMLPPWFCIKVLVECCKGLQFAHEQTGVIHCDLSPGNIMVDFAGVPKILDFGVAHRQANGPRSVGLKGKYRFMAPERMQNLTTDVRSDVYSLGVILYLLLTQRLPFSAKDDIELLPKILEGDPPLPSEFVPVDMELEIVVLQAMAPDPLERYQSASEFAHALNLCASQHESPTQEDVAMFLASVFPNSEGVPNHILANLQNEADDWSTELVLDASDIIEETLPNVTQLSLAPSASVQTPAPEIPDPSLPTIPKSGPVSVKKASKSSSAKAGQKKAASKKNVAKKSSAKGNKVASSNKEGSTKVSAGKATAPKATAGKVTAPKVSAGKAAAPKAALASKSAIPKATVTEVVAPVVAPSVPETPTPEAALQASGVPVSPFAATPSSVFAVGKLGREDEATSSGVVTEFRSETGSVSGLFATGTRDLPRDNAKDLPGSAGRGARFAESAHSEDHTPSDKAQVHSRFEGAASSAFTKASRNVRKRSAQSSSTSGAFGSAPRQDEREDTKSWPWNPSKIK